VLNGLVVMTAIRQRLDDGVPLVEAIREGMTEKMRAVIMTGFVPAIGFMPMDSKRFSASAVRRIFIANMRRGMTGRS